MTKAVIQYKQGTGQYYIEDLGSGIELEMVYIPDGTFTMGAPETEEGSSDSERPQHQVTLPFFFMGKYPITQAQWRAVAKLPQVERELNSEPSRFKGDNLPVEQVSWYDAVEFCARLSNHTRREYHLPSEAEWEYACRAGTTTPFHFGETITTDLANYRGTDNEEYKWSGSYGQGPKGIYREKTTPVGSFDVANAFGLYDMHGNAWEWCLDDWHDNYEGAPTDGSAWVDTENQVDNDNRSQSLRGGSWLNNPAYCRSAYRSYSPTRDDGSNGIGFRVVCGVGRTL
ncbi:formylglycine-generating enzyme family protein [Calothrix sp. CCY 0018]|uniref:formylglycine-generating enzyme family protein n=1 Tax=Calothrix sp. CCY 0018 TaxID=3103864 RepID=UPI0039C693CC